MTAVISVYPVNKMRIGSGLISITFSKNSTPVISSILLSVMMISIGVFLIISISSLPLIAVLILYFIRKLALKETKLFSSSSTYKIDILLMVFFNYGKCMLLRYKYAVINKIILIRYILMLNSNDGYLCFLG